MVELPQREQVNTSFDMLHTFTKKIEAQQPSHPHRGGPGSSDAYRDKYQRCPTSAGWIVMLEEGELLLPDPESPDSEAPELDQIEGLSLMMTQVMNHFQQEEHHCFVCGVTDHFVRDCPHRETFHAWHREYLNSKGVGLQKKVPTLKSPLRK